MNSYTKQDLEDYNKIKHIEGFEYSLGWPTVFDKKQKSYLKSFTEQGNKLYTYDIIKMIVYLFPLEEAKNIINGKEIDIEFVNEEYKPFIKILKLIKRKDMNLLENIFRTITNNILSNPISSKEINALKNGNKGLEILKDAFPEEIVEKILKKKISNKKITELDTSEKIKPFVELLMLLRRKNATDEMYDKLTMLYEKYKV